MDNVIKFIILNSAASGRVFIKPIFFLLLITALSACTTNYAARPDVQQFINQVSAKDQFSKMQLTQLFSQVKPNRTILHNITTPHEAMPWYAYRAIFLQPDRVQEGVNFWRAHAATLNYAEQRYGVPAEIIVAILGVETRYGQLQGNYPAIGALSTLAFDYPPRAHYFRSELEQYLLLTREASFNPLALKSSYAGALGAAQFMPSSYRTYAISYNGQRLGNLFGNADDAIVSIANYLSAKGWQRNGAITARANLTGQDYLDLPRQTLKPQLTLAQLSNYKIFPAQPIAKKQDKASLISLTGKTGVEYWLGFHNFYVITRYNTSPLYAMAVYQLSDWIRADYYRTNPTPANYS